MERCLYVNLLDVVTVNDRLRGLSGGKVVEDYRHHDSRTQRFLAEILGSVIRRYGSQVTWHSLAADLSIDHPMTVADYVQLLAQMDVLIVQHALREDRLTAAPKKARKVVLARSGGRSVYRSDGAGGR